MGILIRPCVVLQRFINGPNHPPPPSMETKSTKTRSLWLTWDSLTSFDLNRVVRRLIWFPEFRLGSMSCAINKQKKNNQIAKWDDGCRWIWCVALTLGFQRASQCSITCWVFCNNDTPVYACVLWNLQKVDFYVFMCVCSFLPVQHDLNY